MGDIGTSPYVELERLGAIGFDVVIFPLTSTLATISSVYERFSQFKENALGGMRAVDDEFADCPVGSLHEFAGFPQVVEWEEQYMPVTEQDKYEESLGDDLTTQDD